jgi:hypothetical protein
MPLFTYQYRREQRAEAQFEAATEAEAEKLAEAWSAKLQLQAEDDTSDDPGELELLETEGDLCTWITLPEPEDIGGIPFKKPSPARAAEMAETDALIDQMVALGPDVEMEALNQMLHGKGVRIEGVVVQMQKRRKNPEFHTWLAAVTPRIETYFAAQRTPITVGEALVARDQVTSIQTREDEKVWPTPGDRFVVTAVEKPARNIWRVHLLAEDGSNRFLTHDQHEQPWPKYFLREGASNE